MKRSPAFPARIQHSAPAPRPLSCSCSNRDTRCSAGNNLHLIFRPIRRIPCWCWLLHFARQPPTKRNALRTFVDRGGKVLATGRNASIYLPHAETENEPVPSPIAKEYQPQLLTPLTRGGAIQMSPGAYWKGPATTSLAHYSDGDRPIVVSYKAGLGELSGGQRARRSPMPRSPSPETWRCS